MGVLEREKKVLVVAYYSYDGFTGWSNCIDERICNCTVYLHFVLSIYFTIKRADVG